MIKSFRTAEQKFFKCYCDRNISLSLYKSIKISLNVVAAVVKM